MGAKVGKEGCLVGAGVEAVGSFVGAVVVGALEAVGGVGSRVGRVVGESVGAEETVGMPVLE